MSEITLRVTLQRLLIPQQSKKYTKIAVNLTSKDSCVSLPNPRFIQDKVANFYSQNLHIGIKSLDEQVTLQVYGIDKCVREIIGKLRIQPKKIGGSSSLDWEYYGDGYDLDYKMTILEGYRPQTLFDDEQAETEYFLNNFDIPNFAKRLSNQSTLVPKHDSSLPNIRPLSQREPSSANSTETRSDRHKQKSFVSSRKSHQRNSLKRKDSFDSSKLTDIPDYKFIQPITHSRMRSPVSSTIRVNQKPQVKNQGGEELGKSRCEVCQIRIPVRNLAQYVGIAFVSFVMGTIVKQGLSL